MTHDEARQKLLDAFHKTRLSKNISVDAEALAVLLYGEKKKKIPKYERPDDWLDLIFTGS